jgi:hypothetical protein
VTRLAALSVLLAMVAGPAAAEPCGRPGASPQNPRAACAGVRRQALKPYDPRDERPREPGLIDLGNGTTVRVRGSVRMGVDGVRR